ncbi:MAG: hypothetical protein CK429_33570 [Mycobacterium sp.]|nr:MAG: hypothetical protein CK429_33570 [Mycobacterium sp.]
MATELRYDRWFLPLSVPLGLGPKHSVVRVQDGTLSVKFGWGFDAAIPVSSITDAKPSSERVLSWGAHGFRGRWLVNGSSKGIVEMTINPPARARVMSMPTKLKQLYVSVTDPDALIKAVTVKA